MKIFSACKYEHHVCTVPAGPEGHWKDQSSLGDFKMYVQEYWAGEMLATKMCVPFSFISWALLDHEFVSLIPLQIASFEQFWKGVNREISICRALYSFQSTFLLSVSSKS